MSTLVAPSGESLRSDGRYADRIVSITLAPLYLSAYLHTRTKPETLPLVVLGSRAGLSCSACQLLYFVAFCLRIIKLMMMILSCIGDRV